MGTINDPVTQNAARVDTAGHLHVTATVESVTSKQAKSGAAWDTQVKLTLGDAVLTPFLYMKNTGATRLLLDLQILNFGLSTSGTGHGLISVRRNPDAGTIVSDANAATVQNRDFGASAPPTALVYAASATGKTVSGGTEFFENYIFAGTRSIFVHDGSISLPTGSSISVAIQAPASNSNMVTNIGWAFHEALPDHDD